MLLHLRNEDGDHEVTVVRRGERWQVTVDGAVLDLDAVPDGAGGWAVTWQDRRRRLRAAARGDERFVFLEGRSHRLLLVDPDHADDAAAAGPGAGLCAAMPGKVVRVLVARGAAVSAGQPLVILESMKMETELTAAVAGTVARVHVEAGQVVAQGDPLVDLDADGEPSP